MSRQAAFGKRMPTVNSMVNTGKMLVLLTIASVVLSGCATPGSAALDETPSTSDTTPSTADTVAVTGCPTPTPQDTFNLDQDASTAGQSIQEPATLEGDTTAAGDENTVPSLAEREAMLDRVNQGPVRPGVELAGDGVPPDPNLSLQPGSPDVDATAPVSATTHLDANATTPTPCP